MIDKSIRILLIEDDEEDYMITQDIIEDIPGNRYNLSWANSYEKGLKAIQKKEHDIYLIDYQLGKESGLQLIQEASLKGLNRPAILLTGNDDFDLDLEAMKIGASGFLIKGQISPIILDRSLRYSLQLNQTIKELRHSQSLLIEAEHIAKMGHFEWYVSKDFIIWSDEHYRIFGLRPQSVVVNHESYLTYVVPEDLNRIRNLRTLLHPENNEVEMEYHINDASGKRKCLQTKTKGHFDAGGTLIRINGVTQDITEQRERENRLNVLRSAIENAAFPISWGDMNAKIVFVNQAFLDMWGYSDTSEVLGRSIHEFSNDPEIEQKIMESMRDKGTWKGEDTAKGKDGQLIPVFVSCDLIRDHNGQAVNVLASFLDISEQVKAREILKNYTSKLEREVKAQTAELALNQAKLVQASNLAKIGYWEVDLEGTEPKLSFSKEFCQLYGVVPENVDKDNRFFLKFVHPDDHDRVIETTKNVLDKGLDHRLDYKVILDTGQERYFRSELKCIKNENGKVIHLFSVVQDITKQRNAELQLENALAKERELNQLKSRFVSMASHEFRTPLSSIMSSISLIQMYNERGLLDKQIKHVDRIRSSIKNLITILNDFLSLEKLESGKVELSRQEIDLQDFLTELKEEMTAILKDDQTIEHLHEGDITVAIDPNLTKNILINLLSNAIKYSTEGKAIKVLSRNAECRLFVDIVDQGIGIPEEEQKHMFSRFFRAKNVESIQGTGLGLTIVKRYLDLMGGKISFISKHNEGTTFSIEIPLK